MRMMKQNLAACFAICALFTTTLFAAEPASIVVVPLHGEVSEAQFFFLRRALKEAERAKAEAVVLDMDTYGGNLQAAVEMQDALLKTSVPTLTYINSNAGSAGAFIAMATKRIYMAPVSAIGAAAPVGAGGEDLSATMKDKTVSYFSNYLRSAAEHNGHNPDLAEAFVNKEKEVKVGDVVVHAKGSLLTLSAQDAARSIEGKPLLAAGIAESLDDVIAKAGLHGTAKRFEPTGFETLAFWITALAPLFLLLGMVGAYLEFKLQGTLIPGIVAAICFILFFAGHYVAGLAGWEVFAIFLLGVALVISELALHPGTVIPGVLGMLMMVGALFWAMIDHYPSQPLTPSTDMLWRPLMNLGIAVGAGAIAIAVLAKALPHTPLYHRFVLGAAHARGPAFSPEGVESPTRVRVNDEGIASSMLRPSGRAQFGDFMVDVITRGDFVEPGTRIRVLAVEGARIVVEEVG
jgi:membrane-bound serine protease (ClpP class)